MRFKSFLLLIILLAAERSDACVCFPIDSISAKELMNEVEYVIVGHAVKNVGFKSEVNAMWNRRKEGYDVMFEVDSVIAGNVNSKTIIIRQFGGNCDQIFEFGEQYLILGDQLEKVLNGTPSQKRAKVGEILPSPMPPPPPSISSKVAVLYNSSDDEVKFWNELISREIVIYTSMCSIFLVNSTNAGFFMGK